MAAAEGRRGLEGGEGTLAYSRSRKDSKEQKLSERAGRRLSGQTEESATSRKCFAATGGYKESGTAGRGQDWVREKSISGNLSRNVSRPGVGESKRERAENFKWNPWTPKVSFSTRMGSRYRAPHHQPAANRFSAP